MFELNFKKRLYGVIPAMHWVDFNNLPSTDIDLAVELAHSNDCSPQDRFRHFVLLLRTLGFEHKAVRSALISFLTSADHELQGTALNEIRAAAGREFRQEIPGEISKLSDADQQALLTAVLAVQDPVFLAFTLHARAILGDQSAFDEASSLAATEPPPRPEEEKDWAWWADKLTHVTAKAIVEGSQPSSRVLVKRFDDK